MAGSGQVGNHLGYDAEEDRLVTHYFGCSSHGYRGWRWSVTVTRASRSKIVTVDECVLLPVPDAVLAPAWVPWDERVEPADLGPGDLLPTAADDPRLVPGYTGADEEVDAGDARRVTDELGLGRIRVLSPEGRDDAADRWLSGAGGPETEIARAAPLPCATCGFLVPLAGALGRVFGACANERSPFDGQVVSSTTAVVHTRRSGSVPSRRLSSGPSSIPSSTKWYRTRRPTSSTRSSATPEEPRSRGRVRYGGSAVACASGLGCITGPFPRRRQCRGRARSRR